MYTGFGDYIGVRVHLCNHQELLLAYTVTPCCGTVITHCAYVVCYFRDVHPFITFITAIYVHRLGLYCILFRGFFHIHN